MKTSETIDILAGIGTFISSIIALFALKEVMKQRRAMYQPKLYFNEFALSVSGNPHSESQSLYNYYLHNLHEPVKRDDSRKGKSVLAQFFFENIGYGVASRIKYEWSFDYEKAVKLICKLDPKFEYKVMPKEKSIMITYNGEYFSSYGTDKIERNKNIDFIKPESLNQNLKPTTIPMIITNIHMDYVLAKNRMFAEKCRRFEYEEFKNFPKPNLKVIYYDIADKKYESGYSFNLSCANSFEQINGEFIDTSKEYASLSFYSS